MVLMMTVTMVTQEDQTEMEVVMMKARALEVEAMEASL